MLNEQEIRRNLKAVETLSHNNGSKDSKFRPK
jgi:hypothetical protein